MSPEEIYEQIQRGLARAEAKRKSLVDGPRVEIEDLEISEDGGMSFTVTIPPQKQEYAMRAADAVAMAFILQNFRYQGYASYGYPEA